MMFSTAKLQSNVQLTSHKSLKAELFMRLVSIPQCLEDKLGTWDRDYDSHCLGTTPPRMNY